jgi:Tfp pilus assembly protein PilF
MLYYHHKKDANRAISFLSSAITAEKNPSAMFNLALIYDLIGENEKAKNLYK